MPKLKYLTNDIDELDAVEQDLEANGIPRSHIHILSDNGGELARHHLPAFSDWSKSDINYYGIRGALFGAFLSACILGTGFIYGIDSSVGWAILGFVAVATMGFCTWEGGLLGVSKLNHEFDKYSHAIKNGEHLLVVDVENEHEENAARYSVESHPIMRPAD